MLPFREHNMASFYICRWTKGFRKSVSYLGKIYTNLESSDLGRFSLFLSKSKALHLIIGVEKNKENLLYIQKTIANKKHTHARTHTHTQIPAFLKNTKIIWDRIYSLIVASWYCWWHTDWQKAQLQGVQCCALPLS